MSRRVPVNLAKGVVVGMARLEAVPYISRDSGPRWRCGERQRAGKKLIAADPCMSYDEHVTIPGLHGIRFDCCFCCELTEEDRVVS